MGRARWVFSRTQNIEHRDHEFNDIAGLTDSKLGRNHMMEGHPRELYIELLKRVLTGDSVTDEGRRGLRSTQRLDNLHECIRTIVRDGVPGDLVEAGVWRGIAAIFMKGVLAAYGETRDLWLAGSFEGVQPSDEVRLPRDNGWKFDKASSDQAVSEDQVRENFKRYELLDERVKFVQGGFRDSLYSLPAGQISLLRLDGDLYESTIQALEPLYPRLSVGGFCVIDYVGAKPCEEAVHDYRAKHKIADPMIAVDGSGVYWRKLATETAMSRPLDEQIDEWLVDLIDWV